jgi:type II secretory pathway pseudopilin PulG
MALLMLSGKQAMRVRLNRKFNKGFTYIGLLLFIAITGIGLSVAGMSWQYQVRAEKEKQLLFVGAEFRNAIDSYYASTLDASKVYPISLNDLLLDKRMPTIKRHLRKIYLDPITGKADWGLVTQQGRIVAIFSKSTLAPFKRNGFNEGNANFVGLRHYKDWIFVSGLSKQKSQSSALLPTQDVQNHNQINAQNQSSTENLTNSEVQSSPPKSNIIDYYMKDGLLRYGLVPNE